MSNALNTMLSVRRFFWHTLYINWSAKQLLRRQWSEAFTCLSEDTALTGLAHKRLLPHVNSKATKQTNWLHGNRWPHRILLSHGDQWVAFARHSNKATFYLHVAKLARCLFQIKALLLVVPTLPRSTQPIIPQGLVK